MSYGVRTIVTSSYTGSSSAIHYMTLQVNFDETQTRKKMAQVQPIIRHVRGGRLSGQALLLNLVPCCWPQVQRALKGRDDNVFDHGRRGYAQIVV